MISEGKDVHDEDEKDLADSSYKDLQGFVDNIPHQPKHGGKPRPSIHFYRQEFLTPATIPTIPSKKPTTPPSTTTQSKTNTVST